MSSPWNQQASMDETMKTSFPQLLTAALVLCLQFAPTATTATTVHTQSPSQVTPDKVKAALPELEKYIQQAMKTTGVPGVSVAVVYQDKVVYLKNFGVREAGKRDPITDDTVFQIASVSKAIASTVVASVVSDGLVSWNSRISQLDPGFQLYEPYVTSQVTVRDLFNHRSGLPGDAGNELEALGFSRDEILRRLRFMPPASSLRSAYSYSNFGLTAGAVAAVKPTGKPWEQVAHDNLYAKLGMTQTTSLNAEFLKEPNQAKLHIRVDGKWTARLIRQPDAQAPAGGVSSTARDLAQWLRLELGNGKFNGEQVIKSDAIAVTHDPLTFRNTNPVNGKLSFYGLGWGTEIDAEGRVYWTHNGAFSVGARTAVSLVPAEQLGIVVLSNAFPTGLPEAVEDVFYDLVHNGKPQKDYLTEWEKLFATFDTVYANAIAAYKTPPATPVAALPAKAYVGTYANDYLGEVTVIEKGDGLVMQIGPQKLAFPLKHWDRDVFLSYPNPESPTAPSPVSFLVGSDDVASQIVISEFNINGQGSLMRVEP